MSVYQRDGGGRIALKSREIEGEGGETEDLMSQGMSS